MLRVENVGYNVDRTFLFSGGRDSRGFSTYKGAASSEFLFKGGQATAK